MQWEDAADDEEDWETAEAQVSVSGVAGSFDINASAEAGVSLAFCLLCCCTLLLSSVAACSGVLGLELAFIMNIGAHTCLQVHRNQHEMYSVAVGWADTHA